MNLPQTGDCAWARCRRARATLTEVKSCISSRFFSEEERSLPPLPLYAPSTCPSAGPDGACAPRKLPALNETDLRDHNGPPASSCLRQRTSALVT